MPPLHGLLPKKASLSRSHFEEIVTICASKPNVLTVPGRTEKATERRMYRLFVEVWFWCCFKLLSNVAICYTAIGNSYTLLTETVTTNPFHSTVTLTLVGHC